jgi:hypothetical protein
VSFPYIHGPFFVSSFPRLTRIRIIHVVFSIKFWFYSRRDATALREGILQNRRNPHTDSPPFLTGQSHEKFTLLRVAAVVYFSGFFCFLFFFFSLSFTDGHKTLLDPPVRLKGNKSLYRHCVLCEIFELYLLLTDLVSLRDLNGLLRR